jgi:hypothetical protein
MPRKTVQLQSASERIFVPLRQVVPVTTPLKPSQTGAGKITAFGCVRTAVGWLTLTRKNSPSKSYSDGSRSARVNCETIGRGEKVVDFERDIDCQRIWGDLGEQRHGGN